MPGRKPPVKRSVAKKTKARTVTRTRKVVRKTGMRKTTKTKTVKRGGAQVRKPAVRRRVTGAQGQYAVVEARIPAHAVSKGTVNVHRLTNVEAGRSAVTFGAGVRAATAQELRALGLQGRRRARRP